MSERAGTRGEPTDAQAEPTEAGEDGAASWPHGVAGSPARVHRLLGLLLVVGFALAPWFLFERGLPQPAHYVLLFWAATVLYLGTVEFFGRFELPVRLFAVWGVFVGYVVLTNAVWALLLAEPEMVHQAAFYVYNLVVGAALAVFIARNPDGHRSYLRLAIVGATACSLLLFLVNFVPGSPRQVGGFNNPNQLGYFSLLMICCISLLHHGRERLSWSFWAVVPISCVLLLFSGSLAAAAALAVAGVGLLVRHGLPFRPRALLAGGLVVLGLGVALVQSDLAPALTAQWEVRMAVADRKVGDMFVERAYDRILEYPGYVFLGAGERALWRFGDGELSEIHSAPATVLFSYGIPGMVGFVWLLWIAVKGRGLATLLLVAAPLVYSLSHQGLRTTPFWVLLVLAYYFGAAKGPERASGGEES